ncbi:MAG: hypothetical protein EZS28_035827 [Streblomastix strix]|uniref:Uncharacterized protein n=1 Tax=Streblomastix strix TaxID=222440 RepID=A0A5J4UEJ9_9EUKA|nr:MAG: hypothetical protein EZS28_035827 [Streblomastix strix]
MTACLRLLKDEDIVKKAGNTAVQVSVGGNTVSLTVVELYNQIAGQVWKTIDALIKLQIDDSGSADEIEDNLGPNTIEAICQLMLDIAEKMPEQAQQLYNSVTVVTFVKQIIKHEENENSLAAVKTLRSAMKKLRINI